jgi:hypothetical protein
MKSQWERIRSESEYKSGNWAPTDTGTQNQIRVSKWLRLPTGFISSVPRRKGFSSEP